MCEALEAASHRRGSVASAIMNGRFGNTLKNDKFVRNFNYLLILHFHRAINTDFWF
jgi:hypothetical protein